MIPGRRYRIIHDLPPRRKPVMSVMDFMEEADGDSWFSARPVGGTQKMPTSWIRQASEVPKDSPIRINVPVPA